MRSYFLAFNENLHLLIQNQRIVDFFAFLYTNVGSEFGNHFRGIKYVISEYLTDERHDERGFGCFFRLD